jgi:Trk-type K+ transport system membrane component
MSNQRIIDRISDFIFSRQEKVFSILNLISNITLVLSLAILIYALGWDLESDEVSKAFRWLEVLIIIFVIDYFIRLIYADGFTEYWREKPSETILVGVFIFIVLSGIFGIDILYTFFLFLPLQDFNAFYEFFIVVYILILAILGMARASQLLGKIKIQPATTFIASFIILILSGALFLMMPAMTTIPGSMRFIDALFTSASAACVTGLSVQDTATFFTFKGQVVILILIQLGGIGIVSFATFFATFLSSGVGLKQQAIIQDVLSTESLASAKKTLRQVIILTFLIEAIGAVAVFFSWQPHIDFHTPVPQWEITAKNPEPEKKNSATEALNPTKNEKKDTLKIAKKDQPKTAEDSLAKQLDSLLTAENKQIPNVERPDSSSNDQSVDVPLEILIVEENESDAAPAPTPANKRLNNTLANKIWYSIFHAVSAFCNAGFSLFSGNLYEPGVDICYHLHLVIAFIIIFGSLGYTTITDVFSPRNLRERMKKPWKQWSLGSQIAVNMTIILTVVGTVLYFFLEQEHTLAGKNLYEQIVTSFFQAVTPRTAGFNTIDMSLKGITEPTYLLIIFMMFIGAASGSTGGGIKTSTFFLLVYSTIASITGKKNVEVGKRTIPTDTINRVFSIVVFAIFYNAICIFLLSIVQGADIRELVFEQISAFATVGLSNGITASLNDYAKGIIILTMYVGRVGTLTLALALSRKVISTNYQYPTAYLMVG